MPANHWSDKPERQYEHIKSGLEKRGKKEAVAEEIAARTVNKVRAQHGESKTASKTSTRRRAAQPARRFALAQRSRRPYLPAALRASPFKVDQGRSKMSRDELEKALTR